MIPRKVPRKLKEFFRSRTPTPSAPASRPVTPDPHFTAHGQHASIAGSLPATQISDPTTSSHSPNYLSPTPAEASRAGRPIPGSIVPVVIAPPVSAPHQANAPFASTTPAPAVSDILTSIPRNDLESSGNALAWKVFKEGLGVLKEVSVVFPPLQAAAGGLFRVLEQIDGITDAREDLAAMAQRITALASLIRSYDSRTEDEDVRTRLEGMAEAIKQQTLRIEKRLEKGIRNIATNSPDAHYIIECTRVVSFLIDIFEVRSLILSRSSVLVSAIENQTRELNDHYMLEKLAPVAGSCYNETGGHGGECMPGTRVSVLAELMTWATDPQAPPIYLLTGMAGAGKSAIARTFARLLDRKMLLGASFFCPRASEARSNVGGIIPSLTFHLAWHSEPYARALIDALKTNPGVTFNLRPIDFQFTTLMLQPSQALINQGQALIVIIDALDECSSIDSIQALLKVLIQPNNVLARRLRLHDVERDIVTADISRYLTQNLHTVASRINTLGWPSDRDLQELVKQTGGLFIFAFTAIQYLSAKSRSCTEVQKRLQNILHSSSITRIQTAGIDALYGQIINNALNGTEPDEWEARQQVLTTLVCLREPISLSAIAGLLREDPENLEASLSDFHSVIDIPASLEAPVLIFHASFPDYMTDVSRSGHHMLDVPKHHARLALQCIRCMNFYLHENLCSIKRGDSRSIITESAMSKLIPAHLKYAAIYWGTHLSLILPGSAHPNLCLSVIGKLNLAVNCLQKAILFSSGQSCGEIKSLLDEVQRMVPQIFRFASIYPLEVYHSALAWLPIQSRLRKMYNIRNDSIPVGLPHQWAAREQILPQGDECWSVAFSSDGTHLATGLANNQIHLWNIETGDLEQTLEGHSHLVSSVAFSLDGAHIASGSYDNTVRIWNVATGDTEWKLVGHSSRANSVAFSPDGAHIASGSDDHTVRIWNAEMGTTEQVLMGHSDDVYSVAFSPDVRIWNVQTGELEHELLHSSWVNSVAFSPDGTIRIWNIESGEMQKELEGHLGWRKSVAFSPDGNRIALGSSDKTVRIWNVKTGEGEQELLGHSDCIQSVTFSPDGSHIASGSDDKTVLIWNVENRETKQELAGHSESVQCVTFSPDGANIASGSKDNTVQIWNVKTGELERELVGHSSSVYSVAFSPDGGLISSGSWQTVRIWNVQTGETVQALVGNSHWVNSLAFSPDSLHLAGGDYDNNILIWNVGTGEMQRKISGLDYLWWVAYSTDGTHIVSGSRHQIVQFWNVQTGENQQEPAGDSRQVHFLKTGKPDMPHEPICELDNKNGCLSVHSALGSVGNQLWLWSEYQPGIQCFETQGTKACIGYESGRVVVVDLADW
ncbi:WD40-repeat-containing domain protein [Mycena olivaceomarginata]|nr:WD40-repeat-containing domain protein [Mycena olivaceomarginata]